MPVKPRKRMHNVKEEDITNPPKNDDGGVRHDGDGSSEGSDNKVPQVGAGMCSTQKSTSVIKAEREQEAKQKQVAFTEGDSNVEETVNNKPDTDEPDGSSTDTKNDNEGSEVRSPGAVVLVEKTEEEKRREVHTKERVKEMDKGADAILSCLDPSFSREFYQACEEYKCKGIGIYILATLNRLAKQADFYDVDFEPEWEAGNVGFVDKLKCHYCNKEIKNPTRMKQKFCNNLCAKYDRERNETGLIFPEDTTEGVTVEEQEEQAFNDEKKRLGEE
jgi:hypothetical protein